MHSRRFTPEDQAMFAALSGDSNPMHMDALAARRTQAGVAVVHGVHALLWALDRTAADGVDLAGLQHLKVQFAKFIPVGEMATLAVSRAAGVRLTVMVSGLTAIVAVLRFGVRRAAGALERAGPVVPHARDAAVLGLDAMEGLRGWLEGPVGDAAFVAAFPHAAGALSARVLCALAQTSRLVGMVCPGLHSIFAGLAVELKEGSAGAGGIGFEVTKCDARFRLVEMAAEGDGLAGKVSAFVRQAPVGPPSMAELAGVVGVGEFAGIHALVVGGSRGLGALTAMLLAAGGARVTITYARGRDDAEHVRDLIAAARGEAACSVVAYDAMGAAAAQLAGVAGDVTQLYYFATPQIFLQKAEGFSGEVFRGFCRVYVDAFYECCMALTPRPGAVFYPSSVAVEERPAGMLEYTMAKAAGEMLCENMRAGGWKVVQSRLPRLLTDQTAVVAQVETADPVAVMLGLVREMQ